LLKPQDSNDRRH